MVLVTVKKMANTVWAAPVCMKVATTHATSPIKKGRTRIAYASHSDRKDGMSHLLAQKYHQIK